MMHDYTEEEQDAYDEGYEAGLNGNRNNPYSGDDKGRQLARHIAWYEGWCDGYSTAIPDAHVPWMSIVFVILAFVLMMAGGTWLTERLTPWLYSIFS